MATREYSFYPGCSSQKGASSSNYLVSVQTMCDELDIQLNDIPDWNCCSASIGYAATWTSNLFFAFSTVDYFAELRQQDLFLHTWSLGVEEQFYLVWPLLIGASLGLHRRCSIALDQRRWLLLVFASCLAASLLLSLNWSFDRHLWGFYLMPARIWEFALGALVYTLPASRQGRTQADIPATLGRRALWLAGAGLVAIAGSATLLDPDVVYPGYWALVPAAGAAMLIAAGALDRHNPVSTLLAHPAAVWIGDRSYSWYLWHWPLIVFIA